jgi:hypothetical protein
MKCRARLLLKDKDL